MPPIPDANMQQHASSDERLDAVHTSQAGLAQRGNPRMTTAVVNAAFPRDKNAPLVSHGARSNVLDCAS